MPIRLQAGLSLLGRILLCGIFFMSAVANKIPSFQKVADLMATEGVPMPQLLLAGAIVFLIAGSVSIVLGFRPRVGALLLLIFLVLATYFFHDFWTIADPEKRASEMIGFMKNTSLIGAMLLIIANGVGSPSLDDRLHHARSTRP